jgi:sugar (pentulose or hexulose) kinase
VSRAGASALALDLGTTFVKGARLDLDAGRLTRVERLPFPPPLDGRPPGHHEVDPAAVVAATRGLLARLSADGPAEALVVSGQMHGLVLTTERGEPRSPVYTWQDQRALERHPGGDGSFLEVLTRRLGPEACRRTGHDLWAARPLALLFWLAETGRLPAGPVMPVSLPDFVVGQLAGAGSPPVSGPSQAAATAALDLTRGTWDRAAQEALGRARLRWPALVPETAVVGQLTAGGATLPWHAALGDQQAALLGAALEEGELSLNVSTGSQAAVVSPILELGPYTTRPFTDGRWLRTVVHLPAGRALAALVRLLSELALAEGVTLADPWATIERAAAAVADTDLEAELAFFPSALGDRGALTNLHEGNLTVGHVFLAAYRRMARGYEEAAARLGPGRPWRRVVFSGGLVQQSPLLRRLIVGRLGLPSRAAPAAEDVLTGLLAVALAATGRARSCAEAAARLAGRNGPRVD